MSIETPKNAGELINMNNKLIDDNLAYRKDWEEECKAVTLSYKGNKFPVKLQNVQSGQISSKITRSSTKKVSLNLVKRQWRVISNYLLNNEPQYLITEKAETVSEDKLVETRQLLDCIFMGGEEENEGFYDTIMDDTIFYGIHRGICWTFVYFDKDKQEYRFKSYDAMDTYIDMDVNRLCEIKKFLITYTAPKEDLKTKYPLDAFGESIKWDQVGTDNEKTASDIKKSTLVEKTDSKTCLVREGYYIEGKKLYVVKTLNTVALERTFLADMAYMPATYFAPMGDPGEVYPRSWFADMVELEKEINLLVQKMSMIVKTGGRYVYVREGTIISKSTNNLLNSLGIEVLEVSGNQEIPKQAQLLTITPQDIQYLEFMMAQAEEEGGMKGDIMGTSTTGANASGRAIQALQAGSKNNIGPALNELNKYMNRLVRILMHLFEIYPTAQYYSAEGGGDIKTGKGYDKSVRVKVSITGRDAFDEVTKQLNAIDILKMIKDFDPEAVISPATITKIMGVTNDIADDIQADLDKQEDPDLQIAEGQTKKLLQGIPQNANESDNHQVFIALFSEALKNVPPESPAATELLKAIRMHEAFMQTEQSPAGPQPMPKK